MAEIEDLEALKKKRDQLLNEVGSEPSLKTPPARPAVRSPPTATPTPPGPTLSQPPQAEDDEEEDSLPPYKLSLGVREILLAHVSILVGNTGYSMKFKLTSCPFHSTL